MSVCVWRVSLTALIVGGISHGCCSSSARPQAALTDESHCTVIFEVAQTRPWALYDVSRTVLVLYSDGRVLLSAGQPAESGSGYLDGRLSPAEVAQVAREVCCFSDRRDLEDYYDLAASTDLPILTISLRGAADCRKIRVDGLSCNSGALQLEPEPRELPVALGDFAVLYSKVWRQAVGTACEWMPRHIEIAAWDFAHARSVLPWPPDWPVPPCSEDPNCTDCTFVLPGEYLDGVRALLRNRPPTCAIEIADRKWTMSWRPLMPHEEAE
ncbi:MAG: hypothetical protein GX547_04250 [Phycisphaerae bacterium]|nr:hypothetical protein [Phycisphaerae bacterium]